MASNDVKIVIKATDEASPTFNTIKSGLGGVSDAMRKVQTDTNSLSGYIKEQRKEGREHKFIIGEMKDGLAAAGLMMNLMGSATGGATGQMKTLTDSVNKGIVVFYGMDAVVSILGKSFKVLAGPIGLAFTAVVAIGGAIVSYISESNRLEESNEKTKKGFEDLTTQVEALEKTLKGTIGANKDYLVANILLKESEIDAANIEKKRLKDLYEIQRNYEKNTDVILTAIGVTSTFNSKISDQDKIIKGLNDKLKALQSSYAGLGATVTAQGIPPIKDLTKEAEKAEMQFWKTTRLINKLMSELKPKQAPDITPKVNPIILKENLDLITNSQLQISNIFGANFEAIDSTLNAVFSGIAISMQNIFAGVEDGLGNAMKTTLNMVISTVEGLLVAAAAAGKAFGVLTFGVSLIKDIALIAGGFALLEQARGIVNRSFHTGGTAFVNAPANREVPIMVRGQETIRVTTPEQERRSGGGGIVINFNSPVSDVQFVKNSIIKVLQDTGLSVDKAFSNNKNKLSFA